MKVRAIFFLIFKSLRHYIISTSFSVISLALAVALLFSTFTIQDQSQKAFDGSNLGFDAVLGARGSQLQLVLSSIFHLETSPGNIPFRYLKELKSTPGVQKAVPIATGDNYRGFRIVGTTKDLFQESKEVSYQGFSLSSGRFFKEGNMEAVAGYFAASKARLKVGSHFHPSHGLSHGGEEHHHDEYLVTGILKPTNTPLDHLIFIPIEGVFRMEGHVLRGAGEIYEARHGQTIPDQHKEVSAVLLKLASPILGFALNRKYNQDGKDVTIAWPVGRVMAEFFQKTGWVYQVLNLLAYLVLFLSLLSLMVSVFNTMEGRRENVMIMRLLGASRNTIFLSVLGESLCISLFGLFLGFVFSLGLTSICSEILRMKVGVVLHYFTYHPVYLWGSLLLILGGCLSGVIPAIRAYKMEVFSGLKGA